VLHHTGAMGRLFFPRPVRWFRNGCSPVALYRRPRSAACGAARSDFTQRACAGAKDHPCALQERLFWRGFSPANQPRLLSSRINRSRAALHWAHDVHDWLGGYPYESTDPAEVSAFLAARDFDPARFRASEPRFSGPIATNMSAMRGRSRRDLPGHRAAAMAIPSPQEMETNCAATVAGCRALATILGELQVAE